MQKSCKTLQSCFDYEWILVETAKICGGDGITLVYNLYNEEKCRQLNTTSIFEHCAYSYVVHCTDTAPYIYIQQNSAELCS